MSLLGLLSLMAAAVGIVALLILNRKRVCRWWLEGYEGYEELPAYQRLVAEDISASGTVESLSQEVTVERGSGALEQSEKTLEDPSKTLEQNPETLEHTLERQNVGAKGKVLTSKRPSKEDLDALKKALGIDKGSMQYKKRGDGVYLVEYSAEKQGYEWKHLGTWSDLQNLIYQRALPQNSLDSSVLLSKEG